MGFVYDAKFVSWKPERMASCCSLGGSTSCCIEILELICTLCGVL